jgi:hypothetical protein
MTRQTTEAAIDPRLPRTRILKLMGFIVATAILLAIWNYAITLEFPPANISEFGFTIGSLFVYYGPGRGNAQGKQWLVIGAIGAAAGWAANLAWLAIQGPI